MANNLTAGIGKWIAAFIDAFYLLLLGILSLVIIYISGINSNSLTWILFLIALPLLNALIDFLSLAISRKLAWHLAKQMHWLRIFYHIAFDAVLAVVFLLVLATALPWGLQIINRVFVLGDGPIVPWLSYLEAAQHDPWGEGLIVTGMLLSTLIPTALHLLLTLVAFSVPRMPWHGWFIGSLKRPHDNLSRLERWVEYACFLATFVVRTVLIGAGVFGVWVLFERLCGPLAKALYDNALYITQWTGGRWDRAAFYFRVAQRKTLPFP